MDPHVLANSLISQAERFVSCQQIDQALQKLMEASSLSPENLEIQLKQAHCYLLSDNFNTCYTLYMKIAQEGTTSQKRESFFGLAELNYKFKNYHPADYFFQSVLSQGKDFEMVSSVYLKLGIIQKKLGNYQKALSYFKAASQIQDLLPVQLNELLLQLANTFEHLNNKKLALDMYLEAVKMSKNTRNVVCLAWIFMKTSKFEKAESLLIKSCPNDSRNSKEWADSRLLLAICYHLTRKSANSEEIMKEILNLYPNEPYYCAFAAVFAENLGKDERAVAFMYKAVNMMPDRSDLQQMLSALYEKISRKGPGKLEIGQICLDITEFPFNLMMFKNIVPLMNSELVVPQPVRTGFYPMNYRII
jgi:tetratricopeptide (TPR) repeat protein